jgi:predicted DNA binding CopG/RHH family protein
MNSNIPKISDEEERELMESSERGEWIPAPAYEFETQKKLWEAAAKAYVNPERQRISISIPKRDLARLKTRAAEEGMPYQTLINSILHKYVSGN